MAIVSLLLNLFFLLTVSKIHVQAQGPTTEFSFRGFRRNQSVYQIAGAATIKPDGLLRLTNRNSNVTGTAFYHKPVRLLQSNSTNSTVIRSFSTSFVFVIIPSTSSKGGFGFTFTLSPTPNRPNAGSAKYLGVFNKENDGDPRNHVFAVEFDTVQGPRDDTDRIGNDIGLNYNSRTSDIQEPVVYYDNTDPNKREDFDLESGNPIQALINYDGPTQTLNVTVYPARLGFKPTKPLISRQVPRLLEIVQEEMYVGFTAATGRGEQSSAHYVMGWSFSSRGDRPIAETLELSELPPPPKNTAKKRGLNSNIIVLIVALSGVAIVMLVLLFVFVMYKKRLGQEEVLEDWEIDHPRRFKYRDLYVATDGFKKTGILGTGGFGTVFKGKLPNSGHIAVKKIIPNSMQGVREFVAEIESLGRLRHKNLVNLQGWCKNKNDLLLVYDYIPNGSLDTLLYNVPRRNGSVLPWNTRFQIAKGIASGLLYLHEEWEKIVIHRDVKPSNVLIADNMNPRLGDFGLARLYERGSITQTTALVGTIGYVAPELARNGKPSAASDVYAFGVLLLEIISGRKPTDGVTFFLVDWVMELHVNGEILSAIDERLGADYDEGEARLALAVGLLCCHHNPESRPSMRMVLRFLNREEDVAEIDDNWRYSNSPRRDIGSIFSSSLSSPFSFASKDSST